MDSMGEALKPPHPVPICVFYSIFTLIDDLLIRPLRLRLTGKDSIGAFVRARVVLSRSGGVYADASQPAPAKPGARRAEPCLEPLATLERFLSAYAMYCLETDVEPLLADEVVKAIKAPGVGLAVHQYTARQVKLMGRGERVGGGGWAARRGWAEAGGWQGGGGRRLRERRDAPSGVGASGLGRNRI